MKKILFFHQGRLSDINGSVYRGLCTRFSEAEVRRVDINVLLKAKPWIIAVNLVIAVWTYGWDMVRRRRNLDESFFGTRYIFHKIHELAGQAHKAWPADCSFQTWSMFDFSTPGVPHFVYADHTHLSRKEYPDYGKEPWACSHPDWLIDLERGIYRNAACIFTWSQNVTRTLVREYGVPEEKVLCVGVGTNASYEDICCLPIELERYRSKRIVFVGRSVGQRWELKGGPELVAAFRRVREVHPDARLAIVGCTPDIDELSIDIVGTLPFEQVIKQFGRSAVFCMPTKMEPFGIVFLEALAAGLPVVALRLGAAPDFVVEGETGILVEHGDIAGLADALNSLLSDPERAMSYGRNGRLLVKERYQWDAVFRKIEAEVSDLVSEGH